MVNITKLDNPDMLKLLDVPLMTTFTNTKQEILIKLHIKADKYKAWLEKQDDDELKDDFRENAYAALGSDILLYVFGLTGGVPKQKDSREAAMADYFWKGQNMQKPATKEALLATEQLAKYLIYESKNNYAVNYKVYGSNKEILPEEVTIRYQLAEPLDKNWEELLETRMNRLFATDMPRVRYKHWATGMYDLADIILANIKKRRRRT